MCQAIVRIRSIVNNKLTVRTTTVREHQFGWKTSLLRYTYFDHNTHRWLPCVSEQSMLTAFETELPGMLTKYRQLLVTSFKFITCVGCKLLHHQVKVSAVTEI